MEINSIEELNKLEDQIRETQKLLESSSENDEKIKKLRTQQFLFMILSLLLIAALVWALFFRKTSLNSYFDKENLVLIDKDSLVIYKNNYFTKSTNFNDTTDVDSSKGLDSEKVIYSVQIGAFNEFSLSSTGIMNLSEFQSNGYNKFSMGNYKTYAEAIILKDSLRKLGFNDCFLAAKSFGNPIDIRKALELSDEPYFLEQ